MSDEYGANKGYNGSLVDNSLDKGDATNAPPPSGEGNYPPPSTNDSTSSGGYGTNKSGDSNSYANQRGLNDQTIERGVFGGNDSNNAQSNVENTGGYQPRTTSTSEGEAAGTNDRREDVTESGGAARVAGTYNNVGA